MRELARRLDINLSLAGLVLLVPVPVGCGLVWEALRFRGIASGTFEAEWLAVWAPFVGVGSFALAWPILAASILQRNRIRGALWGAGAYGAVSLVWARLPVGKLSMFGGGPDPWVSMLMWPLDIAWLNGWFGFKYLMFL